MVNTFHMFPFGPAFARSLSDLLGDFNYKSSSNDINCYKSETDDAISFMFDVPGVKKEDLNIAFDDNGTVLSVDASRKFDTTEVKLGAKVSVPEKGDVSGDVKCSLVDGVLTVTIPTKKASQPRKLTIE